MNLIKKIIILSFISLSICRPVTAQKKAEFSSAFKAGLLNGEADKAGAELQMISGIAYNTWFSGIGSSIDYYSGFKSIPVFIEVKKDLRQKKNTPFVSADLGYNWALVNKDYKLNYGLKYRFQGGLYYEVNAGYKFVLNNSLSIALSAGYSCKNFKEKDTSDYGVGPLDQPLPPRIDLYDYKFRRMSIQVTFWFQEVMR